MKRPFVNQAHRPDPWWVASIQGAWFPAYWETGPTGTVIELEDFSTFVKRCWIGGDVLPGSTIQGVRIIRYPLSWWRRFLLRLAGIR